MNKKKFLILLGIIVLCVTIIFLTIYSETRTIKLPSINDINIEISSETYTIHTKLNGEEKKTIYSLLQNTNTIWKPFDSYPERFFGKDALTIFVTGNTVPYFLTITALPNGDSFNELKPYAFVQFNGSNKYRVTNDSRLLNYLKKYVK